MKDSQKKVVKWLQSHHSYAHTQDLRSLGLQSRQISSLVTDGILVKVRRGLYKLSDAPVYEHSQLVEICIAQPKAVIALASAFDFHGLSTYSPSEITIALPHNYSFVSFEKSNLPIKAYYFPKSYYDNGIETINIRGGAVRIYCKEKTVCDMFRYRKTFGDDIALEGLKNYLATRKVNIQLLHKYAALCNVSTIITPYIKAMVAR